MNPTLAVQCQYCMKDTPAFWVSGMPSQQCSGIIMFIMELSAILLHVVGGSMPFCTFRVVSISLTCHAIIYVAGIYYGSMT